jgi:hypothetical protein
MINSDPPSVHTIIVQWGNSDDKLTQKEWSEFCSVLAQMANNMPTHFFGFSSPVASWQNGCWVFASTMPEVRDIKFTLANLATRFKQDTIALTIGITEFVKGK